MSGPAKNKENFRLLDMSSDEEFEELQLDITPSRRKKVIRKNRQRSVGVAQAVSDAGSLVYARCVFGWAVRGAALCWLLTLTWLAVALYQQVGGLRAGLQSVSTSSESVSDAIQLCHSASKELRANASQLSARLGALSSAHTHLAERVATATRELSAVSEKLSAAPELADTPLRVKELQRTVADFGSQLSGLDDDLKSTHKQVAAAAEGLEGLKTALTALETRGNETAAADVKRAEDADKRLVTFNETLTARLDALQSQFDEEKKPSSTVAPTAAPVLTTSSVAAVTANNTQAPPPKPIVTH